jgi:site-specific DNA-cytosine methylase
LPDSIDEATADVDHDNTLSIAFTSMREKLSQYNLSWISDGLHRISKLGPISYGSGYSGSEIMWHVLQTLATIWSDLFAVTIEFQLVFTCEEHTGTQDYIRRQHPSCPLLFRKFEDLSQSRAFDMISGSLQIIPYVALFSAGFPCVTRSPLNNKARKDGTQQNCVQQNVGKTGNGWVAVEKFLRRACPKVVLLENVSQLMRKGPGDEMSDADYIMQALRHIGYTANLRIMEADEFGSVASRRRIYIVGTKSGSTLLYHCYCHRPHRYRQHHHHHISFNIIIIIIDVVSTSITASIIPDISDRIYHYLHLPYRWCRYQHHQQLQHHRQYNHQQITTIRQTTLIDDATMFLASCLLILLLSRFPAGNECIRKSCPVVADSASLLASDLG